MYNRGSCHGQTTIHQVALLVPKQAMRMLSAMSSEIKTQAMSFRICMTMQLPRILEVSTNLKTSNCATKYLRHHHSSGVYGSNSQVEARPKTTMLKFSKLCRLSILQLTLTTSQWSLFCVTWGDIVNSSIYNFPEFLTSCNYVHLTWLWQRNLC